MPTWLGFEGGVADGVRRGGALLAQQEVRPHGQHQQATHTATNGTACMEVGGLRSMLAIINSRACGLSSQTLPRMAPRCDFFLGEAAVVVVVEGVAEGRGEAATGVLCKLVGRWHS